jgi:hypothetical protein
MEDQITPLGGQQENDSPVQGQDINDDNAASLHTTRNYIIIRGPEAYRSFISPPDGQWDTEPTGVETIADIRAKLARNSTLEQPIPITVTGTLFPCALLAKGWWDTDTKIDKHIAWRNKVQEWLFHGFDLWGPSWDFTWGLDHWEESRTRDYFFAQLGDGDEANSLPVLIPNSKAQQLREDLLKIKWGGIQAKIKCVLGYREHFARHFSSDLAELSQGL